MKGRSLDNESKRKMNKDDEEKDSASAFLTTQKRSIFCYICGKKSHFQNECRDNAYRNQRNFNSHPQHRANLALEEYDSDGFAF